VTRFAVADAQRCGTGAERLPPRNRPVTAPAHGHDAGATGQTTKEGSFTVPRITLARALIAGSIAATAILAGGASASPSGSSRPERKVHVLKVHRDAGHDVFIDADRSATPDKPAPDSVGDQDVFNGKFFLRNQQVGRDGGVCTLVELPSIYHCNATNWFDKGQLTVQFIGDFSSTEPGRFAITGGTGAYRGARGEVKYVAKPDGAEVTFRFRTR
jgi:hypothetical protein